jgi:hypothetical protein
MSNDETTPSFAVTYYPDDLQVRLFFIDTGEDGEEEMYLIKIFPSPAGPDDANARSMLTRFLLYFQYEA